MKLFSSQRFYAVYSGVLTAVLAVVLFSGFDGRKKGPHLHAKELTVERINLVEPDGTLRMVITNKARAPGIYIKNVEHLPGHHSDKAGMLFMNDEGTETGGLTFRGYRDENGNIRSSGHLAFDRYMQDQVITLSAQQENEHRTALLNVLDQPSWPITEFIDLVERISDLPEAEQEAAINEFLATHDEGSSRMTLGRMVDRSVGLELKDEAGRPRIVMRVEADGTARLQFLDETGAVVSQLPAE